MYIIYIQYIGKYVMDVYEGQQSSTVAFCCSREIGRMLWSSASAALCTIFLGVSTKSKKQSTMSFATCRCWGCEDGPMMSNDVKMMSKCGAVLGCQCRELNGHWMSKFFSALPWVGEGPCAIVCPLFGCLCDSLWPLPVLVSLIPHPCSSKEFGPNCLWVWGAISLSTAAVVLCLSSVSFYSLNPCPLKMHLRAEECSCRLDLNRGMQNIWPRSFESPSRWPSQALCASWCLALGVSETPK